MTLNSLAREYAVVVSTAQEVTMATALGERLAKARAGKIREFTGVSAPYEAPAHPEVELATAQLPVSECVSKIIAFLASLEK